MKIQALQLTEVQYFTNISSIHTLRITFPKPIHSHHPNGHHFFFIPWNLRGWIQWTWGIFPWHKDLPGDDPAAVDPTWFFLLGGHVLSDQWKKGHVKITTPKKGHKIAELPGTLTSLDSINHMFFLVRQFRRIAIQNWHTFGWGWFVLTGSTNLRIRRKQNSPFKQPWVEVFENDGSLPSRKLKLAANEPENWCVFVFLFQEACFRFYISMLVSRGIPSSVWYFWQQLSHASVFICFFFVLLCVKVWSFLEHRKKSPFVLRRLWKSPKSIKIPQTFATKHLFSLPPFLEGQANVCYRNVFNGFYSPRNSGGKRTQPFGPGCRSHQWASMNLGQLNDGPEIPEGTRTRPLEKNRELQ